MSLSERLRRLDDAVLGPPPDIRGPAWTRTAFAGMGTWTLLLVYLAEHRTIGWAVAAAVFGAVEVPAYVAALRWHYVFGSLRPGRRLAAVLALPLAMGIAVVTAAAAAPAPWARSQVHYARGCHPAPTSVVNKIEHSIQGDFRIEWAVVVASKDAAVASALLSGTLDVDGRQVPLDRQPADYALVPGPLAANNDLARRVSPGLPTLIAGGPIGSAVDQVNNDRVVAENCAAAGG